MTQPFPGYPPAQYPQQPQYPAQAYPQQTPPQYAPPPQYPAQQFPGAQGYPTPQIAPPAAPLAQGSLDDFFNQPATGGGKSLSFDQVGTRYVGIVTRPLGPGDVQQQTDTQQRPLFFKDGRPKFVMKVPLQMQPGPAYPDGLATWFVKGQARDELVRAMSEAGAPAGPPEAGAIIDITHTGTRPSGAGMNPAKLFAIRYNRPNGAAAQESPSTGPQTAQQAPTVVTYAPGLTVGPGEPVTQLPPGQAYVQAAPQPQYQQPAQQQPQFQPPAQPQQQPAAPAALQMPAGLDPEQQALLAKLTGQV